MMNSEGPLQHNLDIREYVKFEPVIEENIIGFGAANGCSLLKSRRKRDKKKKSVIF